MRRAPYLKALVMIHFTSHGNWHTKLIACGTPWSRSSMHLQAIALPNIAEAKIATGWRLSDGSVCHTRILSLLRTTRLCASSVQPDGSVAGDAIFLPTSEKVRQLTCQGVARRAKNATSRCELGVLFLGSGEGGKPSIDEAPTEHETLDRLGGCRGGQANELDSWSYLKSYSFYGPQEKISVHSCHWLKKKNDALIYLKSRGRDWLISWLTFILQMAATVGVGPTWS